MHDECPFWENHMSCGKCVSFILDDRPQKKWDGTIVKPRPWTRMAYAISGQAPKSRCLEKVEHITTHHAKSIQIIMKDEPWWSRFISLLPLVAWHLLVGGCQHRVMESLAEKPKPYWADWWTPGCLLNVAKGLFGKGSQLFHATFIKAIFTSVQKATLLVLSPPIKAIRYSGSIGSMIYVIKDIGNCSLGWFAPLGTLSLPMEDGKMKQQVTVTDGNLEPKHGSWKHPHGCHEPEKLALEKQSWARTEHQWPANHGAQTGTQHPAWQRLTLEGNG